jgi:hypothetical protein
VVLAYRVQKLLLSEGGNMSAKPFSEGAYFVDKEKERTAVFDAELEEFEKVEGVEEIEGEEYEI